MSNPTTGYFVANNLANGTTYPKPITAILVFEIINLNIK
jgi:hypothetical protein